MEKGAGAVTEVKLWQSEKQLLQAALKEKKSTEEEQKKRSYHTLKTMAAAREISIKAAMASTLS